MKSLNLAHFKKMKEDAKTVTMGHPSGHQITILKSKISPLQKKQIERLPLHLAQGSDGPLEEPSGDDSAPTQAPIPADVSPGPAPDPTPAPYDATQPLGSQIINRLSNHQPLIDISQQGPQDTIGDSGASPQSDADLPDADPNIGKNIQNAGSEQIPGNQPPGLSMPGRGSGSGVDVNALYQQGRKAISEEADISTQLAQKRVKIDQDDILDRQNLQKISNQNLAAAQSARDTFANYIKDNPIDPKHYQENMSSGSKVATAIGLLLGGISGGLNHTGINPAAEFLKDQINRDIAGQQARQGQQQTLLGANQDLFRDKATALNQTRVNMNDLYSHMIGQAADQLGTQQAQQVKDQLQSELGFKSAQILNSTAMRGSVLQAIHGSGGAGVSPLDLGNPSVGLMSQEQAQKEQASVDEQRANIAGLNQAYSDAAKHAKLATYANPAAQTALALDNAKIGDLILKGDTTHRYTGDSGKAFVQPFLVTPTDGLKGTAALKLNDALSKTKDFYAGQTPVTSRIAPRALPDWGVVNSNNGAAGNYRPGEVIKIGGKNAQILNANGDYRFVK